MNYLETNKKEFIDKLRNIIKYQTFLKNQSDVYPNKEMINALKQMESFAKEDGLKCVINKDGYYGYIEIGSGKELIGILTHIDVVPPGKDSDWNTKPFELTEKDGLLYGRGVSDDKGPLMLIYMLLKELKDNKLNKRIRLIFPTDEESSWRGVAKYNELEEIPSFGFTPDSAFPVTFLEREVLQVELTSKGTDFTIKGGTALNAVPAEAKFKDGDNEKIAKGKSAHAMNPSLGENAIQKLFKELTDIDHPLISFVNEELNMENNGKTLFNKLISDKYADLTLNLGMVDFNKEESKISLDMRIPITSNKDKLIKLLSKKISKYNNIEINETKVHKKVYVKEKSFIVKDLSKAYKEVTGSNDKPQASGGGTYAKAMENVVAYGPLFDWSVHTEHQANEHINFDDYSKAYDIYKHVLLKWTK